MFEITDKTFEGEVLQFKGNVIVQFFSKNCRPCQISSLIIDKVSEKISNLKFCKIDSDIHQLVAKKLQITGVPVFLFFTDGKFVGQIVGQHRENIYIEKINGILEKI